MPHVTRYVVVGLGRYTHWVGDAADPVTACRYADEDLEAAPFEYADVEGEGTEADRTVYELPGDIADEDIPLQPDDAMLARLNKAAALKITKYSNRDFVILAPGPQPT